MHEPSASVWLLDNGCSDHMTGNKNLVANFNQSVKTKVKLGTEKTVEVDGKGVVNILTKQGGRRQSQRGKLVDKSEKCIFTGYSEQSKDYKLYNPVTKKTIISIDVVFKEQEAWNGAVDKPVDAQVPLMEEDDVVEKEQQESQVKTPNRNTPTRTPRFSKQHGPSSRSTSQESPSNQSSDESRNGKRKMRSLKDIYDDLDVSSNFSLLSFQPSSFEKVIRDENWVQAMDEEIEAIEYNDTWDLINLPKDKILIGVNWVYKTKLNEKGEIDRFKARFVAKGFSQQPRINFGETFALVVRLDIVRAVLATTMQNKWKVYQMDVKSTFFNGILEES
eukprot:PITA_15476